MFEDATLCSANINIKTLKTLYQKSFAFPKIKLFFFFFFMVFVIFIQDKSVTNRQTMRQVMVTAPVTAVSSRKTHLPKASCAWWWKHDVKIEKRQQRQCLHFAHTLENKYPQLHTDIKNKLLSLQLFSFFSVIILDNYCQHWNLHKMIKPDRNQQQISQGSLV